MAFCSPEDVEARAGKTFTDAETSQAEFLCEAATAVIAAAVDKDDDWSDTYDAPRIVQHLAVELVWRTMRNPDSLRSQSEQLGAYQHSESYRDATSGGGMALTTTEELIIRRAVHGTTAASTRPESWSDEIWDYLYS